MYDNGGGDEFSLALEWDIPPQHLYLLHVLNGRFWDFEGHLRCPSPEEIEAKCRMLVDAVREYGGGTYVTLHGFKVYKDPDFPDSYEIYFKVGHASPRIPEGSR